MAHDSELENDGLPEDLYEALSTIEDAAREATDLYAKLDHLHYKLAHYYKEQPERAARIKRWARALELVSLALDDELPIIRDEASEAVRQIEHDKRVMESDALSDAHKHGDL